MWKCLRSWVVGVLDSNLILSLNIRQKCLHFCVSDKVDVHLFLSNSLPSPDTYYPPIHGPSVPWCGWSWITVFSSGTPKSVESKQLHF